MLYLAYITIHLFASPKLVTAKNHEIKSKKHYFLLPISTAVDPAKRDTKQARIELAMPDS